MKRRAGVTLAIVVIFGAAGVLSNVVSANAVERRMQTQCEASITRVERLWRLPPSGIRRLPASSIRMRTDTSAEGKRVVFQVPPNARPPFCYAYAEPVAPFILRVQYGWATSGPRMAYGKGGEQFVLSVFGVTRTLRVRAHWSF